MFRWIEWPLPAAAAALAFTGLLGAVGAYVPASDQPSLPPARDQRLLTAATATRAMTPIATPKPTPIVTPTPSPTSTPTPAPTPTLTPTPLPTPQPTPEPLPEPTPTALPASPAPALDAFSRELLSGTNEARVREGRSELTINSSLTSSAQAYADLMAQYQWFDHIGPDGSTLASRIRSAGYPGEWLGEVLYIGPKDDGLAGIVAMWLDSPVHRSVLLAQPFTEIGVGCAVSGDVRWCAMDFGGP